MNISKSISIPILFAFMAACATNETTITYRGPETAEPLPSPETTEQLMVDNTTTVFPVVERPEYPHLIETDTGSVLIHMPQVEDWEDYEVLTAWLAIEVSPADSEETWIASIKIQAQSDIDFEERLVVLHDFEVIERNFSSEIEAPESVKEIARQAISTAPRSLPLETILRALPDDFQPMEIRKGPATELNPEPPVIFVSTTPAALMFINGEEIKAPVDGTDLEFVINTNWDLFYLANEDYYYLLNETTWQRSRSLTAPQWASVAQLPVDFERLPNDENWIDVKTTIPAQVSDTLAPQQVFISFVPAEMILLNGTPQLESIGDSDLNWVMNTESDLFEESGIYYYLVTGRWFQTDDLLNGNWQSVESLPANFASIPEEHQRGYVLASVPGTDSSRIAVLEAQIPRKARISVDAGSGIEVIYDGEPQFVSIENTNLMRAVNTAYQVIEVNDRYYLCHNAVWFSSISAEGPWIVASEVPNSIYNIPASDPAHNVTYVYVYDEPASSVQTHISFSYSSGYYGYYGSSWGISYGTGWYYPPYYYYNPIGYPIYWHYPVSYGYGSWYNPVNGRYGERAVAYGPYGGVSAASVYNPSTGAYARGEAVWDYDEVARSGYAYHPGSGSFAASNMYYDFDDNEGWRESYVEQGDRWFYSETELGDGTSFTEFETGRGITGESSRQREDGAITGTGNINFEDRSAQTTSRLDETGLNVNIDGDQGNSLDINRGIGDSGRQSTLTTAEGRTADISTERTNNGVRRDITTDSGNEIRSLNTGDNRTSIGRSENGDLYASRNGEVYRRNENGDWQQHNGDSWNNVAGASRSTEAGQTREFVRQDAFSTQGGFSSQRSTSTRTSAPSANLDRQYSARQYGSRNYNQYQSAGGNRQFQNRGQFNTFGGGGIRRGRR